MEAIIKGLNDGTRREILQFLVEGPKNAGEIAKQFSISKPSISHHLEILKQSNLIDAEKKGQFVFYTLKKDGFYALHEWLMEFAKHFEFSKPKIRL
ncbi:ArsR family transcriptional regulator [Sandaracinomonas limnophila]|uniref:ArsR family transcriptional regulator n=1 Tax=Sandaracinomonas limnophila TaxID=1862386 RepID=A0A437PR22_9BACT|nr:metalloregulator ArsR/SmtB family transcription factor [Sandaracinomonas limnophila]RVU24704.1 ArsR family transcriptional regulator [Sandaracinomonas limnophila]